MKRTILSLLGVGLLFGCSDSSQPTAMARLSTPTVAISEGRFGGNADFFFAAPLAATPKAGDLNFDVGGSNGLLVPTMRICETNGGSTPAGCINDVTLAITGSASGLPMTYGATAELYQAKLNSKPFVVGKSYRIEIWGLALTGAGQRSTVDPRWLFGWQDVSNSPSVSSCTGAEAFCFIKYGQSIPVKVRIEQYVFCPVTRNCAVQFVSAGSNANLEAKLDPDAGAPSAQLFIPGQGGTNFPIAFEPCSPAEDAAVSDALDIPTFGPCLKTVTTFSGALTTPAIVSLCTDLDPSGFGLSPTQTAELALHHFTNDLSLVTALPEAWACGTPTAGTAAVKTNGFMRLASRVGNRLAALVSPRPLFAASRRIDRGGGGSSSFVSSFFKLALPAKFEYEFASDASRTSLAGSAIALRAKVTDLVGDPVKNARVRWSVFGSPSPAGSILSVTPQFTNASGIAEATVQLSATGGLHVFRATGRGIAANGAAECAGPSSSTGSCNGPRPTFDPFMSYHVPEFDASGPEIPVNIAEGTRLVFTVLGCAAPYWPNHCSSQP